ncbi:MAG: YihY family inner membrane protein [Deltaproteobacteria bacterium]|nr:YihY family inner membrane protein [Deltaproteobacteria bacterium]
MNISKIIQFLKIDVWRIRERNLSRLKSFLLRLLRILILSLRGVFEDKCQLRASALTFYSLLSLVPVVAMVFGITRGFGLEAALKKLLLENLEGQEEIVTRIIEFANNFLDNFMSGLVTGIGIVILFLSIIMVLSNIERSFNDIWGIKNSRSITRKISDYLSLMLVCPLLFVVSSTITVVITSQIEFVIKDIPLSEIVTPAVGSMLKLLPYCVIWILFTFMYIFMPNTKVNFRSGALAGVIAGTIYQLFQWGYINFQIGVSKYNAIYGSFAALPLFLIWLQLSWLIVLFGAEISFARQNVDIYEFERDCKKLSHSFKRLLSLRIVHFLVKHFSDEAKLWNETQISQALEIPIRSVYQILSELVESGIISEIRTNKDGEIAYQPAMDTDMITIKYVIDALEHRGSDDIPIAQSQELKRISECLKDFGDLIEKSPANMQLKNI